MAALSILKQINEVFNKVINTFDTAQIIMKKTEKKPKLGDDGKQVKDEFNKPILEDVIKEDNNAGLGCSDIKILILIIAVFLLVLYIFISNVVLSLYYIYYNSTNVLRDNPSLSIIPHFNQIQNLQYITSYFSLDKNIFNYTIILIVIIVILLYLYNREFINKDGFKSYFKFTGIYTILVLAIVIIYIIYSYGENVKLSNMVYSTNNMIYDNLNKEYINIVCNYKNINKVCNNFKINYSSGLFNSYMISLRNEIELSKKLSLKDISIDDFKGLRDKNNVLYIDKYVSAFFTKIIIKYFIDNNLVEESKEYFSLNNLSDTKGYFNNRINIILYLKINNISLLESNFIYNQDMQNILPNIKIYYEILKEYLKLESTISNNINDIYNICKYKIINVYLYYVLIFVISIILIVLYIVNNISL